MNTLDQILTEAINALGKPAPDTQTAVDRICAARDLLYHFGMSDLTPPPGGIKPQETCLVA